MSEQKSMEQLEAERARVDAAWRESSYGHTAMTGSAYSIHGGVSRTPDADTIVDELVLKASANRASDRRLAALLERAAKTISEQWGTIEALQQRLEARKEG
jgi:hypothetical protein